jgi:hypothetical protein
MVDAKKEENLSESNFGHTKDEWGTSKKKKKEKFRHSSNCSIQIK